MHRYDWREFQEFLSPNPRLPASGGQGAAPMLASPAYFVTEGETVVSGYCQSEDLEEWQGSPVADVSEHYKHREHLFVPRAAMSAWLQEAWNNDGYYEQIQLLRARIGSFVEHSSAAVPRTVRQVSYPHFLLEALQGWWAKMLPASYGLFIRVESQPVPGTTRPGKRAREFFVVVRRGKFEEFGTPEFAGLGRDRSRSELETVKYLSEKHGVPFQGVFMPEKDWEEWSRIPDPWKLILLGIRTEKVRLVPFRWSVSALAAIRAYLGF